MLYQVYILLSVAAGIKLVSKVYDNVTRLVERMAVGGGTKTRIYEVVRCTLAFTCPVGTQLVGQMSQKQQYHVQSVYEKTINLTL